MSDRFPAGGIPSAWYVVLPSQKLRPGKVRKVHYFGRDLVVYRTESGVARVIDAACPHLGASLGLASVKGENIVCPMHGFEYDVDGQCAKIAYGTRPPPRARVEGLEVRELNGWIMVWYASDGAAPAWEIDPLDWEGWTGIRHRCLEFAGHPQETTENSVDIGHFNLVHKYDKAWVEGEPAVDGAKLTATYGMIRSLNWIGLPQVKVQARFDVTAQGLGYSLVEAGIPGSIIDSTRLFVHATPIDGEKIHLHIGAAVPRQRVPGFTPILHEGAFRGLLHDVLQDIPFWERKRFLEQPALAEGDGPIPVYRRWCKQFYPSARRLETVA